MDHKPNEQDLELLIKEHLDNCKDYPNVCKLKQTHAGEQRILNRVKEIIFNDGITDIETAISSVDNELGWSNG